MAHRATRLASVAAAAAGLLLANCRQQPAVAPSAKPGPHHDASIASAVAKQLELEPNLDVRGVQISMKHGIAMLRGEVSTFEEARRIARAAQLATGVRGVINWLHVVESSPGDSTLAGWVRAELARAEQPIQGLQVVARSGNVRFEGAARSLQEKRAASAAAWSVDGVVGVDNRLRIVPAVVRSDAEIARDVRERLAADGFGERPVLVRVHHGVVTLSGEVGSIFEEGRALLRAAAPGVVDVDDQLTVTQERERYERPYSGIKSAPEIRAAILDAYRLDPRVPADAVEVDVRSGVVTLTGQVATSWQRFAAHQDALNAAGAWVVENHVALPGMLTPDQRLERRLEARVHFHPYVSGENVTVDVERGHVTLQGNVLGAFQRDTAERVARLTPGVISVENRLTIDEQGVTESDDSQLQRRIRTHLDQAPEVDIDEVRVQVRDGVATISGQVANWEAYDAVLKAVFEALPRRVINHLQRRPDPALLRSW